MAGDYYNLPWQWNVTQPSSTIQWIQNEYGYDYISDFIEYKPQTFEQKMEEFKELLKSNKETKKEGDENTMNLYELYLVYGGDRDNPILLKSDVVVAKDEESAKLKSGILKKVDDKWNTEYVTVICKCIGQVKVKEKSQTVRIEKE